MKSLRTLSLVVLVAAAIAVAPNALAACDTCTTPCGDYYQCCYGCGSSSGGDGYSECRNVGTCNGCMGWYCMDGFVSDDAAPESLEPFHQKYEVADVTIENRNAKRPAVQIAAVIQDAVTD